MNNKFLVILQKKTSIAVYVLLIITTTLIISFSQFSGPTPQSQIVAEDQFSTDRAIDHLKNIAKEPHPIGSQANIKVRDYIINSFMELGIQVEVQRKDISQIEDRFYPQVNLEGKVENIIAKIPGKKDFDNAIILTAHYDSTPESPGAADDGYGVSSILESARALKNSPPPSNTIYFLLTDGEEPGMLGASAFIENKDILDEVKVIINLEARGNKGVPILFETNNNNYEIIKNFANTVEYPVAYSFAYEVYNLLPNDTDFSVYKKINKQGYNFANINGSETYHEMSDNIENIDKETLQHFGINTFSLLKKFAYMGTEEFQKIEESNENAVYFPLFKKSLVVYPESYTKYMFIVLMLLTLLTMFMAFKRGVITSKNLLNSFLLLIGCLIIISILVFFVLRLIALIFGFEIYNFLYIFDATYSDFFMTILTLLAILFSIISANWLVKKFGLSNAAFSSLLIWVILSGVTNFAVPGISYAFIIPALVFLLAIQPVLFNFKWLSKTLYKYLFIVLCLVPGLILWSPILYLMYISMTIGIVPVTAFLTSLVSIMSILSIKWMPNPSS